MKKLVIGLLAVVLGVGMGLVAEDAEAKRFGGGKSSGMSRDTSQQRSATPTNRPGNQPVQNSGMSRWMGPLAGLVAGLGLAALFSMMGLSGEFGSLLLILLIGGVLFFVIRMVMLKRQQTPLQYAAASGAAPAWQRDSSVPLGSGGNRGLNTDDAPYNNISTLPPDFDADHFLRNAKLHFVRLQAANDQGNLDDIREFTTPEMFAEIKLQLQERGLEKQQTDVVTLEAELLDVSEEGLRYVASVRFYGQIRENAGAPEAFDEVWHLTKPTSGRSGWVVAGIQQQ